MGLSIHAPTRGATTNAHDKENVLVIFQPTHPHGVRLRNLKHGYRAWAFQSTHVNCAERYAAVEKAKTKPAPYAQ